MEDTITDQNTISNLSSDEKNVFHIHNEPVMQYALDVLSTSSKNNKIILKAKGKSIPNAVAIANIITENMLKGNSKIQMIKVDSEIPEGVGRMLSNIEIVLVKN